MTTGLCKIVISLSLVMLASRAVGGQPSPGTRPAPQADAKKLDCFPIAVQFSAVPSGKGWRGQKGPLDEKTLRETIDNLLAHGFTGLEAPTRRPKPEETVILDYAQSRGMFISYQLGPLEQFDRDGPPKTCVYSPEYARAVRRNAEQALAALKGIPRLYNVFAYQDEPFHEGAKSFGYNREVKQEFKRRHGYDLPPDIDFDPQRSAVLARRA